MQELKKTIICGDSLRELASLESNSIDSVVTDPPYGLSFMGKKWDYDVPSVELWQQLLQVMKPGAHLLCFAGTRTYHRMVCNIEDAGFEIRDCIQWVYGSGFPKSHNLKDEWQGWGTALKPAYEPICIARKPFNNTVADNVEEFGTGAINIDACRIEGHLWNAHVATGLACGKFFTEGDAKKIEKSPNLLGRWPANLIHDGSEEVLTLFPESKGQQGKVTGNEKSHTGDQNTNCYGEYARIAFPFRGDHGSAARFFYCAKASKKDREEGNKHPTVKPTDLMRYLCRLVTPPNGTVLDPFMGSGSTGKAAILEGFNFVGIEREQDYCDIATKRIDNAYPRNDTTR